MGAASLFVSPSVSAIDGTGNHTGKKANTNQTAPGGTFGCQKSTSNYTGNGGNATLKDGPATFSGPVLVDYWVPEMYYNPAGTYSDKICAAREPGPVAVETASLRGEANGATIKCQWDKGTFQRTGVSAEVMQFLPGETMPSPGQPGTCTIDPANGAARTSNTRLVSEGTSVCDSAPPTKCDSAYTFVATTEGPRAPEPAPAVSSVNPGSAPQGNTGVTVTAEGSDFALGAQLSFSGTGITVEQGLNVSDTTASARITIAADAPVGKRDVTVTNQGGASGVCPACFEVTAAPPPPPPPPPNDGGTGGGNNGGNSGGGSNPIQQGGLGNSGGTGQGQSGPGPEVVSAPPPAKPPPASSAPPPQPVVNVAPPTPPSGGGFVPSGLPMHVPAAGAMTSIEEELQAAPDRGARIMMVGTPGSGGPPLDAAFLTAGVAMLAFCLFESRRGILPPRPEESPSPAIAFARTGG